MWTWLPIVAATLVALLGLLWLLGRRVPEGHVASCSARFGRPPEELWQLVSDFEGWPSWNRWIRSAKRREDPDREVWVLRTRQGPLPSEVVTREAPRLLVTRVADDKLPFGGTWTWRIEPDGGGCRVTVTEDGVIKNPLFRFLGAKVFGYHGTMRAFLTALGQRLGEDVKVEES